jgi:hypothetical protein
MYMGFLVQIPSVKGKIIVRNLKGTDYVYYKYDRDYDPSTQKTNPKRVTIGKRSKAESSLIIRNIIYNCLKDKVKTMDRGPNYMTVPVAHEQAVD